MPLRLYRCHLFSFVGPQTEGVISRWGQGDRYIGGSDIAAGDTVTLYAFVENGSVGGAVTSVRFDVLDRDFLLTGGFDDRIATITTSDAVSDEVAPTLSRRRLDARTTATGTVEDELERLARGGSEAAVVSVLSDPADADHLHIITPWTIPSLDGDAELYFVVHINDQLEDQTEETIRVMTGAAAVPVTPAGGDPSRVAQVLNWRPEAAHGR